MFLFLLQAFAVYAVSRTLWRVFRKQFFPSVLENIPGPKPSSFLLGSMQEFMDKRAWKYHSDLAQTYGGVMRIKALFGEDQLYVYDPKALHNIFLKDQHIFEEADHFITTHLLAFGEGLLGTLGAQHRKQRKMLNPVFSIAHMRNMLPIFYEVSHKMKGSIAKTLASGATEVEMVSWMTRIALELIGQTGLGFSFDPLTGEEPTHQYTKAVKGFGEALYKLRYAIPLFATSMRKIGSPRFRRFMVDIFPWQGLHDVRDIIDVMDQTCKEILGEKKEALAAGDEALSAKIGQGKDIMSILMRANMTASKKESLTESELLGQMSSLIFAAMDTTSNALSRTLHLLAQHPDAQDRLRQELREAKEQNGGEDLSYDALVSLPYLDAICRETLRLYPPLSITHRKVIKDVILPLSTPVKGLNGEYISEITVPKGSLVIISLFLANRNPDIWGPDANEWKPERWLSPIPTSVTEARLPGIYSHLMTFIGGSRACIGFKFSQLEMKVVLLLLIEAFKFSPPKQEIEWLMNSIASPTVKGSDSNVPIMPLHVERA
ncbi:hypothetical protein D9619_006490 [Psilocybe cf. subviscida]|uniref:Cytochrome P450 n=1 Tax=Psilocybe cf. subviscida TaxID=2480587 RepID=A0A8H5EXS2_9AGAR|nr:hypothetical protein D9619_006490 [Psilocybe cf. subviscida]